MEIIITIKKISIPNYKHSMTETVRRGSLSVTGNSFAANSGKPVFPCPGAVCVYTAVTS